MSEASRVLEAAGVPADESRRDPVLLARWLLNWDEARWLTRRHEPPPSDFPARFDELIARRSRREPIAYIVGEREFYGRPFVVTPAVLIPRPETELIVDEALGRIGTHEDAIVVDVGTGSGCLAITLAVERPNVRVVAIDASQAALSVARENARRHDVSGRVRFLHGNLLDEVTTPVGMIVSNPPYVPERDRPSLAPEVRDREPAEALFAGPDGLDVIRALLPAAAHALAPDGVFICEFGWGQSEEVTRLVKSTPGLALATVREDLQRIPRVVVAQRLESAVR